MTKAGGRQIIGYVSNVSARAGREGVVYSLTVSTPLGEEFLVRVRQPPEWLFVGYPISGTVVRVDDQHHLQDMTLSRELQPARAVEVESLEITHVKLGDKKQAIITGRSASQFISAPAIAQNVVKKSEKLQHDRCVIHIASLPTGNKVVAVQNIKEFKRDTAMKRLFGVFGEDER